MPNATARRMASSMFLLLLFAGVVLHPAWQGAHGSGSTAASVARQAVHHSHDDEGGAPSRHDATHCQVCQIAAAGFVPAVTAVTSVWHLPPCERCAGALWRPAFRPAFSLPFSCGPPA